MVCNKQGCLHITYDLLDLCNLVFSSYLPITYLRNIISRMCCNIFSLFSRMMALCLTCSEGSDSLRVNDHIKGRHCRDKKISSHLAQRQKHQEETRLSGSGERKVVTQRGDILKDNFSFRIRKTKTNVKQLYGLL